ncbi:hypothetical protein PENSPDRAFT_571935 [Peniophora sp. CONT]|nr:hypothetical protein PENSPDRAFT_571935 [Peniophora sp. CONT]
MLATRWWRPNQLNELAKNHGLVFKKGRFSATEEKQLSVAMEKASKERGCSLEALDALVFPKSDDERDSAFWAGLARAVPERPLIAVYHHVRRKRNPLGGQGKWTESEDDTLKNAVLEHGEQWEKKVSPMVGRSATDCRDRWRNHVKHRNERNSGTWTREEEEKLTRIVNELKAEYGKDDDNDLLWTTVAVKMGHTRGRTQCRMKWFVIISLRFKTVNEKKRWSQADSFILVHKIDSLDVRDDTEVDWNSLADPDWNTHSGHTMQRRWRHMKRKIDGHENMTHTEIMDVLRATTKYAEPVQPPKPSEPIKPPSKRSPAKPFTSKETVSDSDMD